MIVICKKKKKIIEWGPKLRGPRMMLYIPNEIPCLWIIAYKPTQDLKQPPFYWFIILCVSNWYCIQVDLSAVIRILIWRLSALMEPSWNGSSIPEDHIFQQASCISLIEML